MKKYLPIAIFAVAVLFFIGVFFVVRGRNAAAPVADEDESVAAIPFELRPYTTLSPTKIAKNGEYGHWLTLNITKIKVPEAVSLDYLLEYKTDTGTTQGVPGTVKLDGTDIQRDLLLGSESSGKFRYDTGVEQGILTLRFRNSKGKLVGKLSTDFHLQSGVTSLSTVDGQFKFDLAKTAKGVYFVTMNTFGLPDATQATNVNGPFGIFTSDAKSYDGTPTLAGSNTEYWNGSKWATSGFKTGVYISQSSSSEN